MNSMTTLIETERLMICDPWPKFLSTAIKTQRPARDGGRVTTYVTPERRKAQIDFPYPERRHDGRRSL